MPNDVIPRRTPDAPGAAARPNSRPTVLVLQHARCEGPGRAADALRAAGLGLRVVHAAEGEPVPRSLGAAADGGYAGLVVMGGPMGVYAQDRHPHLRDEVRLIEAALATGAPVLGVCLGSQLLAHALGAAVRPGDRKEIGWHPVEWMPPALDDPIVGHDAASPLAAFHWHGDVFDLPSGAERLARSRLTETQAFRHGASAYGLLCHLEVTPGVVAGMAAAFADQLAGEGLDGAALVAGAGAHDAALAPTARRVFAGWAALAAARAVAVTGRVPGRPEPRRRLGRNARPTRAS